MEVHVTRVPVKLRRSPLVPAGFTAWVPVKRTVLIRRDVEVTERLIAHELAHVRQAEAAVWPLAYVVQWLTTGMNYSTMPFEVEARRAETEPFYRAWSRDLLAAWGDS